MGRMFRKNVRRLGTSQRKTLTGRDDMSEPTIQEFIKRAGITFRATQVDTRASASEWPAGTRHYRCTLRRGSRSMRVLYSQGPGIKAEPDAAHVLDCIASDVAGVKSAGGFESWASDMGADADSRKALATYRAIDRQRTALERLLWDAGINTLLFKVERL